MKSEYFLNIARQASQKSDHHTHKMGCVIAKGKNVLGIGYNLNKTHPKSPHAHKSIHAEFLAIINAGFEVDGATAYVFRQHKDGSLAMAKPCQDCWKFLVDSGIKEVVYSFEGSFRKEELR